MSDLCGKINRLGKGIGHPARYRILEALLRGRKTVSELVSIVRLSQPAVSQHLKTLKTCNLVIDERRGQEVFYAVNAGYALNLLKNLSRDFGKKSGDSFSIIELNGYDYGLFSNGIARKD